MDHATDPHALDESVEARLRGESRLRILRLSSDLSSGFVTLRIKAGTSEYTLPAHGLPPELLNALCDDFNDGVRRGSAGSATERRRAKNQPFARAFEGEAVAMLEEGL